MLLQAIVARAAGNPFFLEELARAVGEHDATQGPLVVPETVQGVVAARIDRLSPPAKQVLQVAAIIGKDIPVPLLHAVAEVPEEDLEQNLRRLQAAEFLNESGLVPERVYTFRHILVQEVAYQSLLADTRQQLHQRIAQVLATRFAAIVEIQPELVAHHYTAAGHTEQAIVYWQRAGQRALQHSANLEAIRHLTKGLALLALLPKLPARAQQEIDLQLALGQALSATKGYAAPEVGQTYARARELCREVGETAQLFPALRGLYVFYTNRGEWSTAWGLGEQLMRLAERAADPVRLLEAHTTLGRVLYILGEYTAARTHLEQGIALIGPASERTLAFLYGVAPEVQCLAHTAHTLWCLGYPSQALRLSRKMLALAQALASPHTLVAAQAWAATLHYRLRETPAFQTLIEALLALATARGLPYWIGYGTCWQGWALAMQGQEATGLAQFRQGMETVLATGPTFVRPYYLVLLAKVMRYAGQVEDGLRLLAEALTMIEANGQGDLLAEAYRLQGAFLLHQSPPAVAQAEAHFQQALAIARRQQAKSWELRAAVSLSRLWRQQGKLAEAYNLLAPIYGWFTEGFDTADLQEAKTLLEALS
jgi:predicted ATPase